MRKHYKRSILFTALAFFIALGLVGGSLVFVHEKNIAEAQSLIKFDWGGWTTGSRGCHRICNPFYGGRVIYVDIAPIRLPLALLVSDRTRKVVGSQTGPVGIGNVGKAEVNPINQQCYRLSCSISGCKCKWIFNHAWVSYYNSSHVPAENF